LVVGQEGKQKWLSATLVSVAQASLLAFPTVISWEPGAICGLAGAESVA
jgi:hypothetical protein